MHLKTKGRCKDIPLLASDVCVEAIKFTHNILLFYCLCYLISIIIMHLYSASIQ